MSVIGEQRKTFAQFDFFRFDPNPTWAARFADRR
jgi:hypothetical protein